MRKNIEQLIKSGITAHTVAAETGLPRNTVYRIFTGETKLSNVKFGTIEILNKYWEENKMINVKRTKVLTDSTLKFFSLPQFKEDFKKLFKEENTREILMIIDEDFYKTLLVNPVVTDERFIGNFVEGALDGIKPYKYEYLSTMNNIHENEVSYEIAGSETADFRISRRLAEPYRP